MATCETCLYFDAREGMEEFKAEGICRYEPKYYPRRSTDWCGKHEAVAEEALPWLCGCTPDRATAIRGANEVSCSVCGGLRP